FISEACRASTVSNIVSSQEQGSHRTRFNPTVGSSQNRQTNSVDSFIYAAGAGVASAAGAAPPFSSIALRMPPSFPPGPLRAAAIQQPLEALELRTSRRAGGQRVLHHRHPQLLFPKAAAHVIVRDRAQAARVQHAHRVDPLQSGGGFLLNQALNFLAHGSPKF